MINIIIINQEKGEKTQIISIRNRGGTTRNPTVISKVTECYTQFYANKFNNFNEIDKFLENLNLPELMQDKIANLNCPTPIKKLNYKMFPQRKHWPTWLQWYILSTI